jgi:hypothetical protein
MARCALLANNAGLTRRRLDVKRRNFRAMKHDTRGCVPPGGASDSIRAGSRSDQRAHQGECASGPVGGLLRLWLSKATGQGVSGTDIRQLLDPIGEARAKLTEIAGRA